MKNKLTALIGVIVGIVLLTYMFTFQVRYDEVAVRTTFDRAEEPMRLASNVAGVPPTGVGSGDAVFTVRINDGEPATVTVPAADLSDNADADNALEATRDDLAAALQRAGLAETLAVETDMGGLVLRLRDPQEGDELAIPSANANATSALGIKRHVASSGSLYYEPGLKFRLPWPIHKVEKYSRKLRLIEDEFEELQTDDGHSVVVKMYMTWRIARPYEFFRTLGTVGDAEETLEQLMRSLKGVIGAYRFDELVNANPDRLKLDEIEQACLDRVRAQLASIQPGYGIEVEQVGIQRVMLPQEPTTAVFQRMRTTRERMAENIRASGRSRADTIVSQAENTKQIILEFANRRAEEIRAEGDTRAAEIYEVFAEHEDLAIFLRKIETLKQIVERNTTFILDANQLSVFGPLMNEFGIEPREAGDDAQEVKRDDDAEAPAATVGEAR
ncbi:MAG: SPFH domain-containing protein [Phycisphaeraceae bacterium]